MDRKTRLIIFLLLMICCPDSLLSQEGKAHDLRRQGDKNYDRKEYLKAEEAYRKSGLLEPSSKGSFNLGNSIFKQRRYDEASEQYERARDLTKDQQFKADAWYNLGNAKYLSGEFDQSVEAYKEALRLNPEDLEAKQNLVMALRELQQQQQQQQQQQDDQEQNDDQEQEDQQQQQQQQNEQEQQQQQEQSEEEESESDQQQQQEQQLSKEQAMQLLKIIEEEDQKVQQKLKQGTAQKKKSKDW